VQILRIFSFFNIFWVVRVGKWDAWDFKLLSVQFQTDLGQYSPLLMVYEISVCPSVLQQVDWLYFCLA
jgi:hypothetical protein